MTAETPALIRTFPAGLAAPTDLEGPRPGRAPASPIGAALDLLRCFQEN